MNTKETLLKKYWVFILVLTLVSAGFGFVLGGFAELLYSLENAKGIGWQTGLIFGFIVGICYSMSLIFNNSMSPRLRPVPKANKILILIDR